ncbi:uncharacterized protein LOC127755417 [Oryza glaberrima]|uniref:Uncharacterized protein n=1 Tax=Oryza glaberrima TaxID=4538 RepID=I1R052_ORYGL|nr:uncharacterized protein LOC127755417 [Oryza glaberrima]
MATPLNLLIVLLFIVISVQGTNGADRCAASSSIDVQTINTGEAAAGGGGDTVFEVQVKNLCGCSVRDVRLDGGGFATTVEVDPAVFRAADDGGDYYLVNGGGPIASMATVSFRYTWDHFFQITPRSMEEDQC